LLLSSLALHLSLLLMSTELRRKKIQILSEYKFFREHCHLPFVELLIRKNPPRIFPLLASLLLLLCVSTRGMKTQEGVRAAAAAVSEKIYINSAILLRFSSLFVQCVAAAAAAWLNLPLGEIERSACAACLMILMTGLLLWKSLQ
jgi:hypothetical protein